ncbi:hypothetical protein EHQ71_15595 [Leptospira levettii]|uniref:LA_1737 family protein n=1 Tax=Leptospira levettii TaxID=2023178 RepID=UPI0010835AF6|nr:hypothetical protein [Leptospira levettii]TGM27451.1 hypothetical protein EHQ71_15595 [Leptospira levettii]
MNQKLDVYTLQLNHLLPCLIFFLVFPITAKSWPDLESEIEVQIYGSERSKKYKASNIIYDIEDWKDHYSVKAMGIYRYYDYPLSKSKTFFPFYDHLQSKIDNREYKRVLNYNVTRENDSLHKSIYPFVFWGNNANNSHLIAIPFFYQKRKENQNTFGFPVLPFIFYKNKEELGEDDLHYYRLFTLFHFETSNKRGLSEVSFTPLVYYSKENYLFFPLLLYYQNYRASYHEYWLGPLYYSKNQSKEERLFVLFPFLGSYVSPKKEFDFIFPIYLNLKDKEDDYHINLFWYTKVHDTSVNLVTNEGNVYLDYDFGLFYNLIGISKRTRMIKGNSLKRNEVISSNPEIRKKREFNRENSDQFTGYQLLFGIFSYEVADTRKHIRLLPFAWFTWDEASEDRVVLLPPFFPIWLSYVSDDLEYKIIFPLYGKQKDKSSEIQSYLLNGYIQEEYQQNHRIEKSFFWPIVNIYNSDIDSGHRVLPFYLHNQTMTDVSSKSNTYTLFSNYKKISNKNYNSKEFLIWPVWISYHSYQYTNKESNTTLWITPFFYRNQETSSTRTNLLWLIDWEYEYNSPIPTKDKIEVDPSEKKEKLSHLLFFPFYYSDSSFSIIPLSFNHWGDGEFTTFTLLNYYQHKKEGHYYNLLYLLESENITSVYRLRSLWDYLFSFQRRNKKIDRLTLFWLGYDQTDSKKIINFFPLIRTVDSEEETSKMYGPFLYYVSKSNEEMTELGFLGIGYYHNETKSDKQYATYVLLGVVYQEKTELERGFVKRGSLWGWLWEYQTEENGYEKFSILKLFSYSKEPDGSKKILGISI